MRIALRSRAQGTGQGWLVNLRIGDSGSRCPKLALLVNESCGSGDRDFCYSLLWARLFLLRCTKEIAPSNARREQIGRQGEYV